MKTKPKTKASVSRAGQGRHPKPKAAPRRKDDEQHKISKPKPSAAHVERPAAVEKALDNGRNGAALKDPIGELTLPSRAEYLKTDATTRREATRILNSAQQLQVRNPAEEAKASSTLIALKDLENRVNANADKILKPLRQVIGIITDARNARLSIIKEAVDLLRPAIAEYIKRREAAERAKAERLAGKRTGRDLEQLRAEALRLIDEGKLEEASQLRQDIALEVSSIPEPQKVVVSDGVQPRHFFDYRITDEEVIPGKYIKVIRKVRRQQILRDLATFKSQGMRAEEIQIAGLEVFEQVGLNISVPSDEDEEGAEA